MLKRLVLFLVRKKLGLKKYEHFYFTNQKSKAQYYFADDRIVKAEYGAYMDSGVSLNWLLDERCKIKKVEKRKEDTEMSKELEMARALVKMLEEKETMENTEVVERPFGVSLQTCCWVQAFPECLW